MAKLVLTTLVGGCSLIYSKGNIPQRMSDAMADAEPIDADPSMLTLTDVAPKTIYEGQGDGGSRPAVLVIHGTNFVTGAQVTITGAASVTVDNTKLAISSNSDYIAVPVTAHVDPSAGASATSALVVQVTQPVGGGAMTTKMIAGPTLQGQDELTSFASWQPGKMYSQINLTGTTTIAPGSMSMPVTLRAWSSVTTGDIVAKGGNASSTTGGASGPGGCAGANQQQDATCVGGGKKGSDGMSGLLGGVGGDGGGAGFATMGMSGTGGNGPGIGGAMTGDDMISVYGTSNQAAGGGGGGKQASLLGGANGAGGGGGGGTIELTAGGDVTCGAIDVTGGNGAAANPGGSGGGGAGGAIMVRSGHTLSASMLTAVGGTGGGTAGAGSNGRIRWDDAAASMVTATPAALRGPSYAPATPFALTSSKSLSLVGTPNKTLNVYAVDSTGATHAGEQGLSFDGSGNATTNAPLTAGWNHVCVVVVPNGLQGTATSEECIDVAYLP